MVSSSRNILVTMYFYLLFYYDHVLFCNKLLLSEIIFFIVTLLGLSLCSGKYALKTLLNIQENMENKSWELRLKM